LLDVGVFEEVGVPVGERVELGVCEILCEVVGTEVIVIDVVGDSLIDRDCAGVELPVLELVEVFV
jgi:hypothetical protein